MDKVRITILMPVYNAEAYIAEAIQSVLAQTITEFELLIVNNCSTDKTQQVIKQFTDPRIKLIEENKQGIAFALNKGLQEAAGEYVARFDADDICYPHRLERQLYFLDTNPDYVLCGSDAEYIAENGEHLFFFRCVGYTHEEIIKQLYVYCPFIHSSVMYRKDAVLSAGGYSADAHNFEDYLLWVRLLNYGKYCNLPERLVKVRINPASVTIDEKWRGARFRHIKKKVIEKGFVTPSESQELLFIIKEQDTKRIKESAYYALCGKKFLVNNHQPSKARDQLARAIRVYPLRLDNYVLFMLSYFPKSFINWLHSKTP